MKLWYIPAVFVVGAIAWTVSYYTPTTLRYRWSVEVDTPQGVASGSSVIEARVGKQIAFMGSLDIYYSFRGEAPAIVLPNGKVLFALLGDDDYFVTLPARGVQRGSSIPVVPLRGSGYDKFGLKGENWDVLRRIKPLITIDPQDYPRFVWFRQTDVPSSLEYVTSTDLAASFGPGFAIRRITVQPTDESISHHIDKILPWLDATPGISIGGDRMAKGARRKVGVLSFRRMN
jgi:hypothetical protein